MLGLRVLIPAVALAAAGCMDPNVFGPPPSAPGGTPYPAPTQPSGIGRPNDIRVPAPRAEMPAPSPSNVAVTIEKIGTSAATANRASLAFRYADPNVVVRGGGARVARRNGIRIAVARGKWRAQLDAATRRRRTSSRETMFIVVASGSEGQIAVGSDTYVTRLGYWTPYGYRVLVERGFVGRSLVVRPRILGDGRVEVELWPRFTARGRRGAIDVTELATKVVVRDGQSIVIGGSSGATEDVGAVLFGVGARRRTHTMTVVLTPRIGGAGALWPGGR
jgi:hypothetical protein